MNMQILIKDKDKGHEEMSVVTHHSPLRSGSGENVDQKGLQFRLVKLNFFNFDETDPNGCLY